MNYTPDVISKAFESMSFKLTPYQIEWVSRTLKELDVNKNRQFVFARSSPRSASIGVLLSCLMYDKVYDPTRYHPVVWTRKPRRRRPYSRWRALDQARFLL